MSRVAPGRREKARLEAAGAWCVRLAEGELSGAEEAGFEAWLGEEPENRVAFDGAVSVWRAMEETALTPEGIDLRRSALDSFRRANRSRWTRRFSASSRQIAAIAACLTIAIAGAGIWWRVSPRVYETGVGERRVVVLADGSKLSLDAATRIDVRYRAGRRELTLERGRAKFDVAKDPLRPFSVAAADKVIVATGTEFSVELVRQEVRVILYEGHVAVLARQAGGSAAAPIRLGQTAAAADQALTPGRELVASVAAPIATVAVTDPARTLSWEGGQLVFVDEPLATAVERVNRYSQAKLAIGDAAAGRVLINGVYTAGDTAAFVEGVTGVSPVSVRTVDGRQVLVSRR